MVQQLDKDAMIKFIDCLQSRSVRDASNFNYVATEEVVGGAAMGFFHPTPQQVHRLAYTGTGDPVSALMSLRACLSLEGYRNFEVTIPEEAVLVMQTTL